MVVLAAILGSIGVIALLPAMELMRRALLGRQLERSFDESRPTAPFEVPSSDAEPTALTEDVVKPLQPMRRADDLRSQDETTLPVRFGQKSRKGGENDLPGPVDNEEDVELLRKRLSA